MVASTSRPRPILRDNALRFLWMRLVDLVTHRPVFGVSCGGPEGPSTDHTKAPAVIVIPYKHRVRRDRGGNDLAV